MSRERKLNPRSLLPALTLLMPFSLDRAEADAAAARDIAEQGGQGTLVGRSADARIDDAPV